MSTVPRAQLRATTVERLLFDLRAQGLADSTVRQICTIGRSTGDAAVRDGRLGGSPLRTRAAAGRSPARGDPSRAGAGARPARSHRGVALPAAVRADGHTALRRGGALALRWTDIDLAARTLLARGTLVRLGGTLQVTGPESRTARRHLPSSDRAVEVLGQLEQRRAEDRAFARDSWVDTGFPSTTQLGGPCEPGNALRALEVAAEVAGVGDVAPHVFLDAVAVLSDVLTASPKDAAGHPGNGPSRARNALIR